MFLSLTFFLDSPICQRIEEQTLSKLWWLCNHFRERKVIGEGVEIVVDAVEQDNDEDDEFKDANNNYHEKPQDERVEENQGDIIVSICNTIAAASKKNQTSKRKAKSSDGMGELVEQLVSFHRHIKRLQKKLKA